MLSSGSNVTGELWKTIFPNRRIVRWHLYRNWPTMKYASMGHSCNISNAPNFVEQNMKTVICVFWMNIWYGITFTKTEKVMGKLKKDFFIYIWQNVWFFCPEETLTIFCKIKCQSFNFICQVLEKSLKFAYQSYRLKEYICFRIFLKMRFFWPICELVMFFKSS